jgi:hypothetical protein
MSTPIVLTMDATFYSFNVRIAQKNIITVAVKNAMRFTICQKNTKKNCGKGKSMEL